MTRRDEPLPAQHSPQPLLFASSLQSVHLHRVTSSQLSFHHYLFTVMVQASKRRGIKSSGWLDGIKEGISQRCGLAYTRALVSDGGKMANMCSAVYSRESHPHEK